MFASPAGVLLRHPPFCPCFEQYNEVRSGHDATAEMALSPRTCVKLDRLFYLHRCPEPKGTMTSSGACRSRVEKFKKKIARKLWRSPFFKKGKKEKLWSTMPEQSLFQTWGLCRLLFLREEVVLEKEKKCASLVFGKCCSGEHSLSHFCR